MSYREVVSRAASAAERAGRNPDAVTLVAVLPVANMAEEAKEPEKNLPRSIILAVSIITVVYMLVAITSVSVVDWRELGESDAPLGLVVERATGAELSGVLSVIAMFATANTVLFGMMAASRQAFGRCPSTSSWRRGCSAPT